MPNQIIGIIGTAFILIAFLMNQSKKWKEKAVLYDLFNIIGSGVLVYYSWLLMSYPFIILNAVWLVVSVREIFSDLRKAEKSKVHLGHKRK